jgi:hypothetical protein
MSAAITALGKLGIGDADPVTLRLDFTEFDPGVVQEFKDLNGTRGKYDKDTERMRVVRKTVAPRYRGEPTALEWATILPWALGGAPTGSPAVTYPLGNTAPGKFVHFAPNAGKQWKLSGVGVDGLTVRASAGEGVTCELDLVGLDYTNPTASYPAIDLDVSTQPFLMTDCILTWNGSARQIRDLSLSVRNNIDRTRFLNSLTLTALYKLRREITWSVELPSGDYDTLWDSGTGATGASLSAVFTNGNQVLSIASTAVRFPPRNPTHPFQQEGMLRLEGEAYSAAGATPLTVTLDPGP